MSLKDVDIGWALRRLAERRIEDAMKEGKFDNLSGSGEPLELEPMPADEGARMVWWTVRILKQTGNTDFAVKLSKMPDALHDR